ncbi:MAG: hypothetical protein KatS3mg104_1559 [Phycisphaerae bacterium]|nr:MAG: hypothetical protein KatS3mg104_1559 [Phycisphaerae bacterium]
MTRVPEFSRGLFRGTTRQSFEQVHPGREPADRLLRSIPVKTGDCFYLPSGTVHALGAGCFVAEVQTPSDTTYRVYDFKRIDPATGKERELPVEQALECIDFSGQESQTPPRRHEAGMFTTVTRLVEAPQFVIEKVRMHQGVEQSIPYDQPVVWMILDGQAALRVKNIDTPRSRSHAERPSFCLLE